MTIGVEYQYSRDDGLGNLGVDVSSSDDPDANGYFTSAVSAIGRSSRNFVLIPIKFHPAGPVLRSRPSPPTVSGSISVMMPARSHISSRPPRSSRGRTRPPPPPPRLRRKTTCKWNSSKTNAFGGYVTVKYFLAAPSGKLRLRIFSSAYPASADWFESEDGQRQVRRRLSTRQDRRLQRGHRSPTFSKPTPSRSSSLMTKATPSPIKPRRSK